MGAPSPLGPVLLIYGPRAKLYSSNAQARSSIGRVAVSKTVGCRFESGRACQHFSIDRRPADGQDCRVDVYVSWPSGIEVNGGKANNIYPERVGAKGERDASTTGGRAKRE
jgi:hypothetical protein